MGSKAPTTTSTSTVPPQVLAQYQKVLDRANPIADTPYQPYTGQLTAGMNGLQNQALAGLGVVQSIQQPYAFQGSSQATKGFTTSASSLPYYQQGEQGLGAASPYYQQGAIALGGAQPYYGAAAKLANASAGPLNISQYFNPYTQNVIDATMANARRNDAIQQQGVISGAIGTGNAFGGDRMGVAQAELARNQDLANNQTIAGLESQNYSQALTAAQADQEREAQAASLLGGLGNSQISAGLGYGQLGSGLTTNSLGYGQLGNGLGNLGATMTGQGVATAGLGTAAQNNAINAYNAQMTGGTQAQQTDQNALNAQYQQWANSIAFPYQQLSWLSNISTGIGSGSGGTTTSTGSAPSAASQIIGGATALGALFSLKRGGVVPYRALGGAVGVQSMFPPAGHAIDFSGVPGGNAGGLIPTIQINHARLNAPAAIDPNRGQQSLADQIKGSSANLKSGMGALSGFLSPASYGGASSALGDATGFGGLYRKGGVVGYADGGDVLDFDQRIAPAQLAVAEGDFNPQGDNFTTLDRADDTSDVPLPVSRPQGLGVAEDITPAPQHGLGAARVADAPSIVPPLFNKLDRQAEGGDFGSAVNRTLGFEGGLTPQDTNGYPSNFGINQKANPDIDVAGLTPDKAKEIYKARYWDAIGADNMPPALARVAFDTAVIAGPGKAKELVAASGGDPSRLLDLRQQFQNSLIAANPEKYGPYEKAWNNRVAQLRNDIGGVGSQALAFDTPRGVGGLRGPAALPSPQPTGGLVPQTAPSSGSAPAGGLLGRIGMTEDQRMAMLQLGLGLLASRSPNFGTALGEAGLGAVSSLAAVQKAREEQTQKDREYQLQVQRLNQAADAAKITAANQPIDANGAINPAYLQLQTKLADLKERDPEKLRILQAAGIDPKSPQGIALLFPEKNADAEGKLVPAGGVLIKNGKPIFSNRITANLDPETLEAMAGQYLAGDRTVLQNLGRGSQGAENIVALRAEITRQAKLQGLDPKGIVNNFNEQAGSLAGQRAVGTRAANISLAANEANNMIPIALEASDKVPRTQWMPINAAIQSVQKGTSSPELASFVAATNSLVNSYVRAVSPTGVPTDAMRQHAYDMLNAAQGPLAYRAVVATMQKEMQAALAAPGAVKRELRGDAVEIPPTVPSKNPATASPPAGAISMLKSKPSLRSAFDQKYGAGAAAKVLGQ